MQLHRSRAVREGVQLGHWWKTLRGFPPYAGVINAVHNGYIRAATFDYRHLYGLITQVLRLCLEAMFASVALLPKT
ncbi:hypothetical protein [Pseudomonas sp.]|uniref:hypothetical protein n=1 Tax=Pseudomonas sp. TaxID=306 RepID=UPI002734681E|nr:hypothetical protein [Pseudomonas sp.]